MKVSLVPASLIDTCWDRIEGYLDGAAKYTYGRYLAEDMRRVIEDESHQLWVAFEGENIYGTVVTSVMTYPRKKALSLVFCGGKDLKNWKDPMLDLLKRFAIDSGCDCLESTARKGWEKVFKQDGYQKQWVAFELPLQGVKDE